MIAFDFDNDDKPWPKSQNNYIEMKRKAGVSPENAYLIIKNDELLPCSYQEFIEFKEEREKEPIILDTQEQRKAKGAVKCSCCGQYGATDREGQP